MGQVKFPFIFIIILTFFSLAIRLYRITEPPGYYFDEVYHAVTAKGYADNNPDAYDPFAKAPKEGTAYDWLHPPLAKLIQAGSIKIFGDNPVGWRTPSVIFGTLIIPATFILANLVAGPTVAILAAFVIAFENLTFVMSRIAMNDVFVTFFILISFIFGYLYVQKRKFKYLLLTSIFLGLSVASKWTGAYAILVVGAFTFFNVTKSTSKESWLRRHIRLSLLPSEVLKLTLLIVVPLLIYFAAYGQFWLQGHSIQQFVDLHKQIWWYQNRHDLEHSYGTTPLYCVPKGLEGSKTWCPWVLNARGVYFSYEQYGEKAGYIYALGNPLIFWAGIIAVSFVIGKLIDERKKELVLILSGYFIFWVPWIFSPRILFLYHYLPSIPFLSISLGVLLAAIYQSKFKYLAILIILIFIATFFYFYPISSGWPIKPESIDNYMWLKTWR